jgi:iron-sulfur cluster assembly accessory protein
MALMKVLQLNVLRRSVNLSPLVRESTFGIATKHLIERKHLSASTAESSVKSKQGEGELTLTDKCVQQINKVADPGSCLRVVVESGGCSGFQYKFEIDSVVNKDDRVFEKNGACVVIDCDSLELVRGSVVDFKTELIRSAFSISNNPQAENGCSCGASFNVKI